MFNPNDVFPHPNLSDQSTPWARKLTDAVRSVGYEVTRHGQLINGNSRASSAQLGLVSRQLEMLDQQVTELRARGMHYVSPANLAVTGNATTAPFPVGTRNWTFPAPQGGGRRGLLNVSWVYTNSNNSFVASAFSQILQDGVIIWSSNGGVAVPYPVSSPGPWPMSESVSLAVSVPSGGSTFSLRMYRVGTQSTSTTLTAANIAASISYGDKY